ncbi:MAG: YraN family protein, partial [Oscillospiraceae bacterium]|nr:YraN family protein [Oscillospiraceae bacterium]
MDKRLIGLLGEKLVCKWYTDHKYKLLSVNYKTRFGEIDIIAANRNTIVFVEVKTRKDNKFSYAKEAVNYSKQQKIKAAANQ